MKKPHNTLAEVVVNAGLCGGLLVVLWHQRSNDGTRRLLLLTGVGIIALINLAVFYWPRFADPEYDADADDVDRFKWEMLVLQAFVFLAIGILIPFLGPHQKP